MQSAGRKGRTCELPLRLGNSATLSSAAAAAARDVRPSSASACHHYPLPTPPSLRPSLAPTARPHRRLLSTVRVATDRQGATLLLLLLLRHTHARTHARGRCSARAPCGTHLTLGARACIHLRLTTTTLTRRCCRAQTDGTHRCAGRPGGRLTDCTCAPPSSDDTTPRWSG